MARRAAIAAAKRALSKNSKDVTVLRTLASYFEANGYYCNVGGASHPALLGGGEPTVKPWAPAPGLWADLQLKPKTQVYFSYLTVAGVETAGTSSVKRPTKARGPHRPM